MLDKLIYKINKIYYHIKYFKVKFGKKINFRKRFNIVVGKNANIIIGNNCFFNNDCSINAKNHIQIGDNCIFGENVKIYDHNHRFNNKNLVIKEQGYSIGEIKIGNNCWIGSNVCILKGANIGDNVVISAGVVIDKEIGSNVIVRRKDELLLDPIIYKEKK